MMSFISREMGTEMSRGSWELALRRLQSFPLSVLICPLGSGCWCATSMKPAGDVANSDLDGPPRNVLVVTVVVLEQVVHWRAIAVVVRGLALARELRRVLGVVAHEARAEVLLLQGCAFSLRWSLMAVRMMGRSKNWSRMRRMDSRPPRSSNRSSMALAALSMERMCGASCRPGCPRVPHAPAPSCRDSRGGTPS